VARGIEYARAVGCRRLNCLAGLPAAGEEHARCFETLVENLAHAAEALDKAGLRLLLEPVNTKDVPGFFLSSTLEALRVMVAVAHPNLQLQFDLYHMQRMEGDLIHTINALAGPGEGPRIGHMQIADNPGRHEPGTGEINFGNVFSAIDAAGYEGWVGCEYLPGGHTEDGLGWLQAYL
jgi:hydroxypyruvate isomerase